MIPCMKEWLDRQSRPLVELGEPHAPEPAAEAPKARVPLTPDDLRARDALQSVTFPPGFGTKRFVHDVAALTEMTERQRAFLWRTVYRFRRQIKDKSLVAAAEKMLAPACGGEGAGR